MADLTDDQRSTAEGLFDRLQSDHVQAHLRAGFERDFSNSILDQWDTSNWLSEKQLYWLGEITQRAEGRGRW